MNRIIRIIHTGDLKLFYIFNDGVKCGALDKIIPFITGLGGAFYTIAFSLILILFGNDQIKMAGIQCLATLSTSHILVHYLKKKFTRPRPFLNLTDINTFHTHLHDYSFPSGHTTAAFSLAVTLSILFPVLSFSLITTAFIVGVSRVYLGVHYPTDVFVGMLIGTTFSVMNHILFEYWGFFI
ncbi:MAG: phosphatase PAP2 family protein [Bacillota bacterium]